jgi:tetratricopeptide (TPR) repeat protein
VTANKLAAQGYEASAHGDYDTAIAQYSAALHETIGNDQKAFIYLNRGVAYNFKSRFDDAIRDHTEALRLNSKLADAYAGRGWAYLCKGDVDRAIIDLGKAIKLDPNSQSAYYNRALIVAGRGEFDKALLDFDEAIRCAPKWAYPLVARGLCYAAKNDLDRALASFDGAVAMEPTNATAYLERSKLYARIGDRDKAERDYLEALRLDRNVQQAGMAFMQWFPPNQRQAPLQEFVTNNAGKDFRQLVREAQIAYETGNYENAIALNNSIVMLSVSPAQAAPAIMNRGNAYAARGDLDKAVRDYDEAIVLNPKNAGAYVDRASVRSRKGDTEGAMRDLNAAISLNPQQWQAYFNRSAELRDHGKLDEALADLNEVIKLNPRFAGAYVNRANLLWHTRHYADALSDLQAAVRLKPKKLEVALNSLAWFRATCYDANMRSGNEAVAFATRACELSEWKNFSYIDTLAAAYAEAGNFDQAVKYQKQAAEMAKASPNSGKITERLALYEQRKPYREERN